MRFVQKFKPDSSGLDPATQTNGAAHLDGRLLAAGHGEREVMLSARTNFCKTLPPR